MAEPTRIRTLLEESWAESPRKRMRSNSQGEHFVPGTEVDHDRHTISYAKDKATYSAPAAKLAPQTVAPFLAKHVPAQYAPLGGRDRERNGMEQPVDHNSKFCYRHRPDMLCRRQADEPSMEALQKVRPLSNAVKIKTKSLFRASKPCLRKTDRPSSKSGRCFLQHRRNRGI